ncbi:MAG: DUF624 domain-containing protein [Anaerolineales bacterium]
MTQALSITLSTFRLWWGEIVLLTLLNLAWLALQVPIITGPPATAAMYALARRVADGEMVGLQHGWDALRQMFWPAWKWGAVNLLLWVVVVGNFWAYQEAVGVGWTAIKLLWGAIALAWFTLNLFYWPFWLAQTDKRLRTTLRNSLVFLLKAPSLGMTLAIISLILMVVSVVFTLPLAACLMAWLALMSVLAVDKALQAPLKDRLQTATAEEDET